MVDIYNQFKDFKAFEITFTENGKNKKIICTVRSIENDSIIIIANNQQNKDVFAHVNDDLKLYIYTESGVYSSSSKVLQADIGILNTEYKIAYPTNSKHSQRREFFRADMQIEYTAKITPKDENEPVTMLEGKTKNICGRGMCFVSTQEIPENYDFIRVNLKFKEKEISPLASLVYSKPYIGMDNTQRYIHAFVFNNISQRDIDFIVKKCFLHQLELRKQSKL
ncbi:MAG: PilZ domain-containing protein [bacterium]|nr:PilZ domain-containing protein [bacterium]